MRNGGLIDDKKFACGCAETYPQCRETLSHGPGCPEIRTAVSAHTRKPAKARAGNSDESKVATAATHALNRVPDDQLSDKPHVYAQALAGVCRRWFGDEGLAVARELVRILEADR